MKVRRFVILGTVGLGVAALLSRNSECSVSMHPEDWRGLEDGDAHRRYRSWEHTLHHAKEVAGLLVPIGEIYLRQVISPAFREQIMITTAISNNCPL